MSNNITITCKFKHVDIQYKYVKEHAEDWIVKIVFNYAENYSNTLTKN